MPQYQLSAINTVQLKDFQEWTDQFGMMQDNDKGDTTGNGNLFTAHYVTGLVQKKLITPEEKARILKVFENNFKVPGVLTRAPSKADDRQAHDDIIGLMSAEAQLCPDPKDRRLTKLIYAYGKYTICDGIDPDQEKASLNKLVYSLLKTVFAGKVRWTWNNVNLGKFHVSSWLQRRMEMMATMQMSLREFVNPVYWAYWATTNYFWAKKVDKQDGEDGYILRYHSAMASQGYGKLTDKICDMIHAKIKRDHGDLGMLIGIEYFEKPQHPIVNLLKDIA